MNSLKSLHEVVVDATGSYLYDIGFPKVDGLAAALTEAVDLIANCTEEGVRFYPEIVLTTDLEVALQPITPKQLVPIETIPLNMLDLRSVLKLCAPHCAEGWIIYIEVSKQKGESAYGLLNAELTETAIPARSALLTGSNEPPLIYLSRRSHSVVRIESPSKEPLFVNLGVQKPVAVEDYSESLAKEIVADLNLESKTSAQTFFEKLLAQVLREGHGNLVGVVTDRLEAITAARAAFTDGKLLDNPIDLGEPLVRAVGVDRHLQSEAMTLLTARKSLVKSFLGQDGITVFTTKGRIIAFNVFVKSGPETPQIVGGARTRAFFAMQQLGIFTVCFFKSQDGNEKFWRKP